MVPVSVEAGTVSFEGKPIGIDAQNLASGKAKLFVRPYEMNIVSADAADLRGTVKRVHGIGPARRVEIAIGSEDDRIVEIDAPRSSALEIGQPIGLVPRQYRLFATAG